MVAGDLFIKRALAVGPNLPDYDCCRQQGERLEAVDFIPNIFYSLKNILTKIQIQ